MEKQHLSSLGDVFAEEGRTPESEDRIQQRLAFAQMCFKNVEELGGLIDQKASAVVAVVGLLTAALGIIAAEAIRVPVGPTFQGTLRAALIVCMLFYLLAAFTVVHFAAQAFRARRGLLRPDTTAPGLIFPLILLERYKTDDKPDENLYLERLARITPIEILQDYAHQIVGISYIYRIKEEYLNQAVRWFQWMSTLWAISITLAVITVLVPT